MAAIAGALLDMVSWWAWGLMTGVGIALGIGVAILAVRLWDDR